MIQNNTPKSNGHYTQDDLSPFDDPLLPADLDIGELDTIRRSLIESGIDLSQSRYQNQIAQRRTKARDIALRDAPNKPPRWFYGLRTVIQSTGNAILLGVMLILSYMALPVSILGLAYAEIQRVALGVALFDAPRATLMAVVAVSSYLILLVVQAGMNRADPSAARPVWSLRLWLAQVGYILGIRRQWAAQYQTEGQRLHIAITRLGWLIILLGTAGSLEGELIAATETSAAWYQAIGDIVVHSDLMTFISLVGGVSLTAGLLAAMHYTVNLAYVQWQKLIPDGGSDFLADSFDTSDSEDRAELIYLLSLIQKQQTDN